MTKNFSGQVLIKALLFFLSSSLANIDSFGQASHASLKVLHDGLFVVIHVLLQRS